MRSNQGSTLQRLLTAMVLIPALLTLIWWPPLEPFFILAIAGLAVLGQREYYALCRARGIEVRETLGLWCGFAVNIAAYGMRHETISLVLFLAVAALSLSHMLSRAQRLDALAASVFGVVYVGWMPAHLCLLHGEPQGPGFVTMLAFAVALSDTGAYFAGRAFGRHKLAPVVSPNKTWEGAVGGVAGALLGVAVVWALRAGYGFRALPDWSLPYYLATGALLSITSQVGDLAESMLKRDAGVKDSGAIFPGHGGVLDRCDGFLFAAPMLYYLVVW